MRFRHYVNRCEMIEFFTGNVEMPEFDPGRIARWIEAVASDHGRRVGSVNYRFCDDEEIIEVNREFLGHDYYTDVITFDNSSGMRIDGDILISLDTVASNALLVGADYNRELMRVVIHGILHLCGINDKGPGEREIMERHEDAALLMLERI